MAREVAGYDYEKARAIGVWPAVELLEAYESLVRRRALESHQHATLVYASTFPVVYRKKTPKAPEVPPILRRNDG